MGSYQYTAGEKDVNKVLKYQQEQLNDMSAQLKQGNASLVARIMIARSCCNHWAIRCHKHHGNTGKTMRQYPSP